MGDGDNEGISVTFFVVVCLLTFKAPGAWWLPAAMVVSCFGCELITELTYKELDWKETFDTYRQTLTPTVQLLLRTKNIIQ